MWAYSRVARQKRRARSRRRGGLRLDDADLGAGQLRGVAADEVVGSLLAGEPADRRQDAERVRGQEDDVLGRPGDAVRVGIADEVQRVRAPRVLGDPLGVQVEGPGHGVEVDVLQDRPELLRRGEDVGLVHRREADRLGVAATLEVEDVAIPPAVLVVADERSQRVGRERRLPVPERPKKMTESPAWPTLTAGVHRQHALVGHQVVHDREGRLLDLAGVLGADDDDLHPPHVNQDRGLGTGPLGRRVGLERRHVQDREVGDERRQLLGRGPAEEVLGEDAGPGGLGVDAERPAVRRMGADEGVLGVEVLRRDVLEEAGPEPVVVLLPEPLGSRRPTRSSPRWTARRRRTCPSGSARCACRCGRRAGPRRPRSPPPPGWRARTARRWRGSPARCGRSSAGRAWGWSSAPSRTPGARSCRRDGHVAVPCRPAARGSAGSGSRAAACAGAARQRPGSSRPTESAFAVRGPRIIARPGWASEHRSTLSHQPVRGRTGPATDDHGRSGPAGVR